MQEFGGAEEEEKEKEDAEETAVFEENAKVTTAKVAAPPSKGKAAGRTEGRLMVSESRKTGSVGWQVYKRYLKAGRAKYTGPLTVVASVLLQGAQIASTLWLTYWEADRFHDTSGFYMGIYALLGVLQAIFTFMMGGAIGILSFYASGTLYDDALRHLFFAPMSTFETTPLGRIMGVFGKDMDVCDNSLADSVSRSIFACRPCNSLIRYLLLAENGGPHSNASPRICRHYRRFLPILYRRRSLHLSFLHDLCRLLSSFGARAQKTGRHDKVTLIFALFRNSIWSSND